MGVQSPLSSDVLLENIQVKCLSGLTPSKLLLCVDAVRYRYMADCMDHAEDCNFVDWSSPDAKSNELALSTLQAMKTSW